MNWRTNNHEPIHNMNIIAEGYFESAILLAGCCLEDTFDKKADCIIFPMLFSINHAIELFVKSICWSLNILLGNSTSFKKNHDIREIWRTTKQKIRDYGFGPGHEEAEFNNMIINLELYLDELYKDIMVGDINKAHLNIDFSRYPMNHRDENHFYIKNHTNVVVDLDNFILVFKDINDCLSRLAGFYYDLVVASQITDN